MKDNHFRLKMMPLIMGPQEISNALYANTESATLQYETDKEAIASLLPDCYKPAKESLLTVA